jgi:hypothetical protein
MNTIDKSRERLVECIGMNVYAKCVVANVYFV